jgi:hypothetical protein
MSGKELLLKKIAYKYSMKKKILLGTYENTSFRHKLSRKIKYWKCSCKYIF